MKRDIKLLLGIVGILTLASCQNDNEFTPAQEERTALGIIPLAPSFLEVREMGASRADYENNLPKGEGWSYIPYNQLYPTSKPEYKNFGIFLTPERTELSALSYEGVEDDIDIWESANTVAPKKQYYIYGFMPLEQAGSASITALYDDFASGAKIQIQNFKTLTAADVCAIVGLRKATGSEKITGPETPVALGSFGFEAGEKGDNNIFVLLKHLYAGLHFRLAIDPEYHTLRDIKVTEMQLLAEATTEYVNIEMTLEGNDTGDDPLQTISITPTGSATTAGTTLFSYTGEPDDLGTVPEEFPESYLGCFAPNSCNSFILHTTYNVYDKKGNLIRERCQADNKIDGSTPAFAALKELKAGDVFTVDMTIQPTYLYVLSDPDLDNPTIKINL